MAVVFHRKMLVQHFPKTGTFLCFSCPRLILPSPPAPTTVEYGRINEVDEPRNRDLSLIALICIVGVVFLFTLLLFYLYYSIKRTRQESTVIPGVITRGREELQEDDREIYFSSETRVDHHVWHIATVGLRRSAILSIAAFRFKKEEKLIDGTDCSVCLNEFKEDESLRLLPKCCHAFHVDCIDTWLLSHKNCPLCRAPVLVLETVTESKHETEINLLSNNPGTSSEPRRSEQSGDTSEAGDGSEIKDGFLGSELRIPNNITRSQSDLGNHCSQASVRTVRRSFSMFVRFKNLERALQEDLSVNVLSSRSSRI